MQVYSLNPKNFTPVMEQYLETRQKITGKSLLLFRMGDFYEAFFDDAQILARELEITLTGKNELNYPGGRIPMAGVPAKAVKPYIAKLLENNFKVYVAEQMADPKQCKGLVPREVTKIYTPGTINDLDLLDRYQNNFILSLVHDKNFGLAYADISTGEFYVTEIKEKFLEQEIARINPSEIIAPASKAPKQLGQIVSEEKLIDDFNISQNITPFNKNHFDINLAKQNLSSVFKLNSVESFFNESPLALKAAGALIEYFKETLASEFLNNSSKNFDVIKTYHLDDFMMLDANTRRNLELTQCLSGSKKNSLFDVIDKTSSKPGRRRLQAWLEQPLYNINQIRLRQNSIEELINEIETTYLISNILKKTYDLDRLANRLISQLITPRELINLKDSLLSTIEISSNLQSFNSPLLSKLKSIPDEVFKLCQEVENAVLASPSLTLTEGGIIRYGYHQELDEFIDLVNDSQTWLKNYEEEVRQKLGIKLKIGFNKIHGYFIESSRINASKLTEGYSVKQTMVNTIRFVSEELRDFEEKITNAENKRGALEYKIFCDLRLNLSQYGALIKTVAFHVAELDALHSLALLAQQNNYSKPIVNDSLVIEIENGRHPVIEKVLPPGQFVTNNLYFNKENDTKIMILTGPNMAGKSTFMRQNALIILLAQIGSYIPASQAQIGLVDRIFTRIGASDNLASGQSTFMVEMSEAALILNGMSEKSFVILDEIGRGTSTYDGVAIAWSIVEYLAKNKQPRTIFATHYHELAELEKEFSVIKNYQVLVIENQSKNAKAEIEFLHKVVPGSTGKSYGIEVARLAGLPNEVLSRAKTINRQLQNTRKQKIIAKELSEIDIHKLPLFKN